MFGAYKKLLLNLTIVFVSALLVSGCNMVDPAEKSDENTTPFLAQPNNLYLIPGQLRIVPLFASDPDLDDLTYTYESAPGSDFNPFIVSSDNPERAVFDIPTARFYWTPHLNTTHGDFSTLFTVTDNGTPSMSDSRVMNITLTDTLGLGELLYTELCVRCHATAGEGLRELHVPCDQAGLEARLHTAIYVEQNMQFLGFSDALANTPTESAALQSAYNTDISATAEYLANEFASLPYVCSIGDRTIMANGSRDISFDIFPGDPTGYTMTTDGTVGGGLNPYQASTAAVFDEITGAFTWTPAVGDVGDYTVNFTIIDTNVTPNVVVLNETIFISVIVDADTVALGEVLYTQHCLGCHLADASDMTSIPTAVDITAAIDSVPSMAAFDTIIDTTERSAIANYLASLP